MILTDYCYLFAASKEEIRRMIADTTKEMRKRGLDRKEDQMELMAWSFDEKMEMFCWRLTKGSTELRRLKPYSHGSHDHQRSRFDEGHAFSDDEF